MVKEVDIPGVDGEATGKAAITTPLHAGGQHPHAQGLLLARRRHPHTRARASLWTELHKVVHQENKDSIPSQLKN